MKICCYFVTNVLHDVLVVRMKGLEPPRLTALDPKSSAATNYATCAKWAAKLICLMVFTIFFIVYNLCYCLQSLLLFTIFVIVRIFSFKLTLKSPSSLGQDLKKKPFPLRFKEQSP